ncbi:MAG: DUF2339 domain-containing protein [Planctomycetota bacterium]
MVGRTVTDDEVAARRPAAPAPVARTEAARRGRIEFLLGTRVLAGVGALLVLIGLAYFLDLAMERGWVSPTNRVIGGLIASTLAILAAHAPRIARLRPWSDILAGLGFAGWYACTWFAGEVYGLVSPLTALLGAHLATAAAFGSGLLRDRRDLVVAALIGGFVVPLVFRDVAPTLPGLLGYHFLLATGGLAAAVFRDHVGPRAAVALGLVTHATLRATSVVPEDHAP